MYIQYSRLYIYILYIFSVKSIATIFEPFSTIKNLMCNKKFPWMLKVPRKNLNPLEITDDVSKVALLGVSESSVLFHTHYGEKIV